MIHEWPTDASPRQPAPASPQLSRDQKLDLARMGAACVLSLAALGAAAWAFACRDDRREARQDHWLALPAPAVTVATSDVMAQVTTPDLRAARPMAAVEPRARAATTPPAAAVHRTAPRRATASTRPDSLPRRLARFLTGDGRHEPRPFPTIPE